MDTTFRGWSSTLAARVCLVISRLVLIFVSLWIFMASLLASDSLLKFCSSICGVVWSRLQPLACVGAVLSLLGGPTGCDPLFCVLWFRFRLFRRFPGFVALSGRSCLSSS